MTPLNDPMETLRHVGAGPDDGFDLAEAALALAAVDKSDPPPELSIPQYRRHLDDIARELAAACDPAADLRTRAAALASTIHESHGYGGDATTYDDLQNANFMRVIDRRKGLPIALGILYIHAARRVGWNIVGLNFPGHFLLRLENTGDRIIVDPFHAGRVCDAGDLRGLVKTLHGADAELTPDHHRPVSDRDVLLRLQNNAKLRLMQLKQFVRAAETAETMLLFAPDMLALRREAGLLHAQAGNLGHAIAALETYLEHETQEGARHEVASYLLRLRRQLN